MTIKFARTVHPGEYLREEFLVPLGMSPGALAKKLNLPRTRIERIVREEVAVTPDTALRLARFFGMSPQFWMSFQTAFDIETTERDIAAALQAIIPLEGGPMAA
ncbi:HigA family addiction module antitoxin [Aureimonas glaciei]|jgi:addiction module HigA family antidote|uniref:Transcriptional regulator n=1 Tax=Aureimonas glaciei TaxID=1776957 RepID=A0A917D7L9_9HYPH|nr:HigA family addiction module antitoxin [Aureimonas glaciei]GGD03837.1 transcriptional regulator [Aureimonas glaciei]